ncbi:MAG: hypothetical protein AAF390_00035 [Pseudomonadota bacterium]
MTAFAAKLLKRLSVTAIVGLLIVSALTRLVSAGLALRPDEAGETVVADSRALLCPPSEEVSALLERIAARDDALTEREQEVAMREQDATIARQEAIAALDRLAEAEARLAERMAASTGAASEDVDRLVTVYEGMKPKDAAALFESMAPPFAAGFLARMRPDAAAAIFSNLSPDAAYALSVLIAGRNANAATE